MRLFAGGVVIFALLLVTAWHASALHVEGEGRVRVERVAVSHRRGHVTESRVYAVAVFELPLPAHASPLHVERGTRAAIDALLRPQPQPQQQHDNGAGNATAPDGSAHGLSRLLCESQLFESFAPPNTAQHAATDAGAAKQRAARDALNPDLRRGTGSGDEAGADGVMPQWLVPPAPPVYLVPLNQYDERTVHPLYHLVSSLFVPPDAARSAGAAHGTDTLWYALLLSYTQPPRLDGAPAPDVHVMDRRKLRKCRLTFLPPRHQAVQPPGLYVTAQREPVLGAFTFAAADDAPAASAASAASTAPAAAVAAAPAAPETAYYPDDVTARAMFFASQSVFGSAAFPGWKQLRMPCTYSPQTHGIFLQTHMRARGTADLSTRARAHTKAGAAAGAAAGGKEHAGAFSAERGRIKAGAGVVPIIAGLWKGLVTPLLDTLCEGVSDPIGALLYWGVGDVMLPGLRDALHAQLTHAVPPQITEGLVPNLIETIPDTVTHHALRYIEQYTTATLPKRIQAEVTHLIVPIAIEDIARLAKANIPRLTTLLSSRVMGHMLTRALTHTVVPALSHTLSHAPFQEFWCRRCIEEQKMCSRCFYTADKIYYAQFYASYYSTYYSDYYTTYYASILEDQITVQSRKQQEIRRFAERFETVYDDTALHGGGILGHGTWPGLIKIT